jgi:hypothetical protein
MLRRTVALPAFSAEMRDRVRWPLPCTAKTLAELEKVVLAAVGPSEFMEFARHDPGDVLRKEWGRPV